MYKKLVKSLIIFCGLFCYCCDPIDDKLIIENQSNDTIYIVTTCHSNLSKLYQEGLDQYGIEIRYTNYINEVEPNATHRPTRYGRGDAWERYINQACDDDKLRIYTFNIDTLKKYDWKTIIKENQYLRKLELSVNDLDQINWIVALP